MKSLELFCGTKSFSKEAKLKGYETTTLDIDKQHNPTICVDILTWDYKQFPKGYFNVIWASPDCTSWSIACHKHRTISSMSPKTHIAVLGEKLIHKTLEIIKYFKPKYWFIENPRGRLRHFKPMKELEYRTTIYYGNYGLRAWIHRKN